MGLFAYEGHLDMTLGLVMGAGSMAGGLFGAKLAISPVGRVWVVRLLVTVIPLELVHLTVHYPHTRSTAIGPPCERLRLRRRPLRWWRGIASAAKSRAAQEVGL
jgi:hypothetical protein